MRFFLTLIIPILIYSCTPDKPIETKIKEYYSDKLHDPSSFEIAKIKKVDTIYTVHEVEKNLKWARTHLESNKTLLKQNPNYEFYKKNVKKYTLEIENYENKIDSLKNGFLKNDIEHLEIYFSYRAKNSFGALILSDAVANMTYFENLESKDSYGSIYSINEIDSQK